MTFTSCDFLLHHSNLRHLCICNHNFGVSKLSLTSEKLFKTKGLKENKTYDLLVFSGKCTGFTQSNAMCTYSE